MAMMIKRLTTCQSGIQSLVKRLTPASSFNSILKRHSNSQHRVVLLPEVPEDTDLTNPFLKRFDSASFPEFSKADQRHAYFGLGKALLEFETAVGQMERKCEEGVKDFKTLFEPLEKAKCQFESVWNSVNMMGVVSDHLDQDRFTILHKRAERAFLARHNSRTIFKTLQAIKAEHVEKGTLTQEEERILDRYLLEYKHQGFELPSNKFDELNANWMKRLYEERSQYNYRMMVNTDRYRHVITNPNIVQDFPVDVLRAMGSDSSQPSKGPWTVTLHPYIYDQFMSYCPDRKLRYSAHRAKVTRGSKSQDVYTSVVSQVKDIRQHRLDQAVTLGYSSFGQMSMETKMATNVENVHTMIASLLGKAKQSQELELENLQVYAETRGFEEQLEVYDVDFFKRKQRRTILGMSDEDLRNYFPLPKVLTGIFQLCQKLFGVVFEEVKSPEVKSSLWHKNVSLFRVVDEKSGKIIGNFFLDPFIRDDKGYAGGSKGWFIPLRPHSKVAESLPLGALIMSLPVPNYGKPSLLSFAEAEEVLRNFGNLLIHVLAEADWSDLSGKTGIEWDALDLAGNFMTQWLYHPDVLKLMSGHWSTEEPLNPEVVDKLCNVAVRQHLAGYTLCQELYKAAYDISFYTADYDNESYMEIASRLYPQYLLLPPIQGDEFPMYFQEMIGGDFPAAIFCSTWAKMLASDAFSAVLEASSNNRNLQKIYELEEVRKVTDRFRKTFLSLGSSIPMAETFRKFRGRDPSHEALLLALGLKSAQQPKKKGSSD